MIKNKLMAMAVTAAIVLPSAAMATNGMFMMGNGTKSNGRAGAGIAMADTAISGADNPAAMVRVGNRVDFGVQVFDPDRTAEISGSSIPDMPDSMGGSGVMNYKDQGNNDGPFYIPEVGLNYMINNDMSVGVAVVGTGGMNTNYSGLNMFGPDSDGETGINLEQVRILPTLSYKLNEQHSVGISLQVVYQQFKAWGLNSFKGTGTSPFDPQFSSAPNKVSDKGRDDSWGFGVSVGWQGQITDRLTIGATYNSKVDMDEMDDYEGLLAEQGDMDVPENYGIGLAFKATDKLLLAFDVQQINYSDVDSIANTLQSGNFGMDMMAPGQMLGDNNGSGFGWDDMTVYKLGAEYQVNDALTLRAGYSHADQPIDKDQTMFNILAPATIEDHATIGMTYKLPNESEISMFYMHAFEEEVNGSNSIPGMFGCNPGTGACGSSGEADIKMSQDAWGIAYGWNF